MGKENTYKDLPIGARIAIAVSVTVGVGLFSISLIRFDWTQYWAFLFILAVAGVTANTTVRLLGGSSLSLLTSVVLMSLISLGPDGAVMIAICGVVFQTAVPARTVFSYTLAFNVGMIGATVWGAGRAYQLLSDYASAGSLVALLVASLVYYFGNSVFVSMIVGLSSRKSPFKIWHDHFLYTAPAFFMAGVLAFAANEILKSVHFSVLLVLAPILYFSYYSYKVYLENLQSEKKHAEDMALLHGSTLETLVLAIDAKDRNQGHVVRVQKYARELAVAIKLDEEEVEGIAAAALLHDIGKLAVPEHIIKKKGALTAEEMAKMRLHPETGADIIANIKFAYPVSDTIRHHHERFDGSGYPAGLKGEDIPLGSRVLAVVDSCESYMSRHQGRADDSMAMLERDSGTHFDATVVAAWKEIYRDVLDSGVDTTATPDQMAPFQDIGRAASEVETLDELAETVNAMDSVQEIAATATRMLEGIVPSTAVFWLPNGDEIVTCVEEGEDAQMLPIGAGVSGWVAAERSSCVNMTANFGPYKGSRVVAVPVLFEDELLGVLSVYRGNPEFSDDEVRLVTAAADRIASSLQSASALEVVRRDATSDRLTGLANRRALEKAFETIAGGFSLVLIDINAFKAVNDTFGHQAGDDALVRIAEHLQTTFDSSDIVCRLGGDEFLVASEESSFALRRKVREFRKMVAQDPVFERYQSLGFGVSWGVAAAPDDGPDLEKVTAVADGRMYNLKTRIKQKVRLAFPMAHASR